jgi:hypothetical protein
VEGSRQPHRWPTQAEGAAGGLTAMGLFKGQSQEFFAAVGALAKAADSAQRQ